MSVQTVFDSVFLAFFGACIGSFLGVVIERVPARESLMGRSHCVCGRQLAWFENIPLVSYLVLRGRSRCCKSRIPAWYFAVELVAASLGVLALLVAGSLVPAFIGAAVGWLVFAGVVTASALQNRKNSEPTDR